MDATRFATRFSYPDDNGEAVTIRYNLNGAKSAIGEVLVACGVPVAAPTPGSVEASTPEARRAGGLAGEVEELEDKLEEMFTRAIGANAPESIRRKNTPEPAAAQTPLQRGMAFLAENGKRANVVTTSSGLQYEVLASGSGDQPGPQDYVSTHYHGTFIGGDVFDSSVQRGEPIEFQVNGAIKGWREALQLMSVGDKWKLYIPSDLAYGANGTTGIGPDETLIFEVELLGVRRS